MNKVRNLIAGDWVIIATTNTLQSRCADRPGSPMIDIVNREAIGIGERKIAKKGKRTIETKYISERERAA